MQEKSNFNQALWLGLSQFCTFGLSFVSAAILSRYFDKVEYGTYRQILFIYNTLLILFTAGLPSVFSYFIPRLEVGAQKTLINYLNRLFLILGAVFSIILFVLADWIAQILENPDLSSGLKIFSIFPLFTLPSMGVEGIYTAIKKAKQITYYVFFSKLLMLVCIVSPVLMFKTNYIGAIIGWGIANFIIFIMAMYMKNKPYIKITPQFIPNMSKMVFEYSLPLMGAFIAGFTINCADQFFISRYYGTATFADFSNGNISIPFTLMIANSVKAVLLPVLSKAQVDGELKSIIPVYSRAVNQSIKIIIPIITFVIIFGKYLMVFIYGTKYSSSTLFFQMHAMRDYIGAIPYLSVLLAFGYSKFYMYSHIFGIIFVWGIDALCVYLWKLPAFYIVLVQSILQFIIVISAFIFLYIKIRINFISKNLVRAYIGYLVNSITIAIITYITIDYLITNEDSTSTSAFISLLLGGILYVIGLILSGKVLGINYLEVLKFLKINNK